VVGSDEEMHAPSMAVVSKPITIREFRRWIAVQAAILTGGALLANNAFRFHRTIMHDRV